jgi:hypothetical protein
MPTKIDSVLNNFYSRPQSKVVLDDDLVRQFLDSALSDYELELHSLDYDADKEEFNSVLSRSSINQLGGLMYRCYLSRELDRVLKLTNIIGKDIGLTGMGDAKRTMQLRLTNLESEISNRFNKMKTNSYYDE